MRDKWTFRTILTAAVLSVVQIGLGVAQTNAPEEKPQAEKVYRVGPGVTPPKALKRVGAGFSGEAKQIKFQGTVILSIVVDEKGTVRDIQVAQSLGHGLDEKAIEAVKQWKFKPGKKDGQPVPVTVTVEVMFHLY
jgi:TonB family protein